MPAQRSPPKNRREPAFPPSFTVRLGDQPPDIEKGLEIIDSYYGGLYNKIPRIR